MNRYIDDQEPIIKQISTFKNLPSLPHIVLKLIKACEQETTSVSEISKIIEKDPSLCTKVLRLVNSAYYGLSHRIETVDKAVAFLGINAVRNIAICASVYEAFSQTKEYGIFNLKLFWWHSLACAVMSRLIAKRSGYSRLNAAFLSGLLHDIGRLVLWTNLPKEYGELLERCEGQPDLLLAGEIQLGASHCEIGAWVLHRWNLGSFLADPVLYHHEPIARILSGLPLVRIVYVANALCKEGVEGEDQGAAKIAEQVFGFTGAEVKELLIQANEELLETADFLDIEIERRKGRVSTFSKSDLEKQQALLRDFRDISLLVGTLKNLLEADDENAILKVVKEGIQILLDVSNILFFLYDPEKEALIGKAVTGDKGFSIINDLIIPVQMEKSLLIASLRQGTPMRTFSRSVSPSPVILDEQVIRFLGKEGMLCLPMVSHGSYVGVIVLGLDQVEFSPISKHLKLLVMVANQAALALNREYMRQARFERIQSERLGASSAMARRVVHEVNNPLSIIKNYLKILGMKLSKQNIAQDEIRIICEEIGRIANILSGLTSLSEKKVGDVSPVDVNALISDLVKIRRESLAEDSGIEVHLDLKDTLPSVMTEKDDLKQVFINLIDNAEEAMPEGGNLYIKTRYISSYLEGEAIPEGEEYEGYVEIAIRDEGPGIPEDIKPRLFEPFVSSKGGDHEGLGLSVIYSIVKALGGTIACETEKDKGTAFQIELPISYGGKGVIPPKKMVTVHRGQGSVGS